jgi:hypothetical protein
MLKGQVMILLLLVMVIAGEPAEQIGSGGRWHAAAAAVKSAGIMVHGLRLDQWWTHQLFLFLLRLFLVIALHVHLVVLLFSLGVSPGGGGGLSAVATAATSAAATAASFGPLVLHTAVLEPDFHLKLYQVL